MLCCIDLSTLSPARRLGVGTFAAQRRAPRRVTGASGELILL